MKNLSITIILSIVVVYGVYSQHALKGTIFDNETKEPLIGANIKVRGSTVGTTTSGNGTFDLISPDEITSIEVSYVGYEKKLITIDKAKQIVVALDPAVNNLQQVVVTASREAALRTESPVAISKLSATTINDTKPVVIAELINKVPGVVMVNYNNEQHAMSIRQPMGTSAYFLYMEDGIPIRPLGVFNHNALIEMNVSSISSIEVVKGPASSLYGAEAVGGAINFITHRPTAMPTARVGIQADQWGYQRLQYGGGGMITKKFGFYIGGFEARQRDAWQTYSDYSKSSVNTLIDYALTDKTKFTIAFSSNEYYSDMAGSVDSIAFYNRAYTSTTDFTYRKVHSQRIRFTTAHQWNENNETIVTYFYRDNAIEQNPNYAIRWTTGSNTATGERNRNSFYSHGITFQHSKRFTFKNAKLLAGGTVDYSPTQYWAYYVDLEARLRENGKSVEKFVLLQERPDLFLAKYEAQIKNAALYSQFEINPVERLKVIVGLRYDRMAFSYHNFLDQSIGSRAFQQLTPKLGATYDLNNGIGLYANYSQGFSPPGLTTIFRMRPPATPNAPAEFYYNLEPARFNNVELGGWASLVKNKIYVDATIYQMIGHQELLNIRQPDNSFDYQSAGKTLHRGIEYGITYKANSQWVMRFGGTNAMHRFDEFILSTRSSDAIKNVNGYDMPQSPPWIANSEITFKPEIIKGLRVSVEWQRIGAWYENQINTIRYHDKTFLGMKGVSYLNCRIGYTLKSFEVFTNVLNVTDELYAHAATRGNSRTDRTVYTPAAPRTFILGMQYNFSGKKS